MAPEITVVPAVAVSANVQAAAAVPTQPWEVSLVRKAAKTLKQPHKKPAQIVDDLLTRLQNLKRRRDLRGLNHWEKFAPTYFQWVLVRHEHLRRRAIEEFFRMERTRALARAEVILGDRHKAEDAVGEAYLMLLAGKSGISHFYRLLSRVCIWRKRARTRAAKVFVRDENAEFQDGSISSNEPACKIVSQGDPLEILIREDEIQEGIRDVQTKRKYRDVPRTDWWKELMEHYCPDEVAGK